MEWLRAATLETHMGIKTAFSIMSKHMCVPACISDGSMTLRRIWHLVVMEVRANSNALLREFVSNSHHPDSGRA